jgi:hypothetical protein
VLGTGKEVADVAKLETDCVDKLRVAVYLIEFVFL